MDRRPKNIPCSSRSRVPSFLVHTNQSYACEDRGSSQDRLLKAAPVATDWSILKVSTSHNVSARTRGRRGVGVDGHRIVLDGMDGIALEYARQTQVLEYSCGASRAARRPPSNVDAAALTHSRFVRVCVLGDVHHVCRRNRLPAVVRPCSYCLMSVLTADIGLLGSDGPRSPISCCATTPSPSSCAPLLGSCADRPELLHAKAERNHSE
jgi:hypothetical protein